MRCVRVGASAFQFCNWPDEPGYYVHRMLDVNLMVNHRIYDGQALEAVRYAHEDQFVFYRADTDLSLKIWQAGYQVIDSPWSICEHYRDPAEAARISNNEAMDVDRAVMRHSRPDLVTKPCVAKMGKSFLDVAPGAEALQAWGPSAHFNAGA